MSPRESIRNEITEFIGNCGLNDVYGNIDGILTPKNNKKAIIAYVTHFCKAAITDGTVRVFSSNKIEISWRTANRNLPEFGNELFSDKYAVMNFLAKNFSR